MSEFFNIKTVSTKSREELKPLWIRMKEYRTLFMKDLCETYSSKDAVSLDDLKEMLKCGINTIQNEIRKWGYTARKIKDDDDKLWLFIDPREEVDK